MMSTKSETAFDSLTGCHIVEWDSEFFGRRIARIEPASSIATAGIAAVEQWCAQHRVECVCLLAPVDDQATCDVAQSHGFKLVDVRVTLAADVSQWPAPVLHNPPPVRGVRPGDEARLEAIARESHRDTRFYSDGHFDRRRCDELYGLWIAKSCRGWANHVLVAEIDGLPSGYLTCHIERQVGRIGLVAVAPAARGAGAGAALVAAARQWFADNGAERVTVATQARNLSALRLYQRTGMTVFTIELWFHRWF